MSSIHDFHQGVFSAFAFLTSDVGFRCVTPDSDGALESVRFEKPPLAVEVGWYKGEVDVGIRVAIDTTILRPYRRKYFGVAEIAKHVKPDVFSVAPDLPRMAISSEDALVYARFYAGLLRAHCQDILRGDIKPLEEIVQKEQK